MLTASSRASTSAGVGSLKAPVSEPRRRRSGRARSIYAEQGADELVVLDVSATLEERTAALTWCDSFAAS